MKELSTVSKTYIFATIGTGGFVLITQFNQFVFGQVGLLVLAALAAAAQVFKVNGPTDRSNYNIAWLLYGFTLINLGVPATLFVIVVAHVAEWIKHRYPWFIQTFNVAVYALAAILADFIYRLINPAGSTKDLQGAIGLLAAILTFTLVNHLLVGLVIRFARGQSFAESGVFEFLTLAIDFTLLGLGVASAIVFMLNPFAAILNVIPAYLLYQALKVPAMGRQIQGLESRLENLESTEPGAAD